MAPGSSFPLTCQQQWLWSLLRKNAGWNCTLASGFRLLGDFDGTLLQQCVDEILRRHSILRARVVACGAVAFQHIDEAAVCPIELLTVTDQEPAQKRADAVRLFEAFADTQLDPHAGPLFKVSVARLSDCETWILFATHRVISDCFSTELIFRELWTLYGEQRRGGRIDSAVNPIQYRDYAVAQDRDRLLWSEKHGDFWASYLANATPLRWPLRGRAPQAPGTLGRIQNQFGAALTARLHAFARRTRSLTATVMLAIFVVVLWRFCRQNDFVLPFNIAGRPAEHRCTVGFFSHILYLRMQLEGSETFEQLLPRVSNELYRALSHQDFGRVAMAEPGLLSGAFFQWITWHPDESDNWLGPGTTALSVTRLPIRDFGEGLTAIPPGSVDVEISFFDGKEGIHAGGVYRADLLSRKLMEQLFAALRSTCQEVISNPRVRVDGSVPLFVP